MVHIVGAGCGAPDLITLRGKKHIEEADVIIYAASLVNPALLSFAKDGCDIYDSSRMTLEEVIHVISETEIEGKTTVRLHTGDPSLYGAVGEQMRELDRLGIAYDITPGVSAFAGAAAALKTEYTLPEVSQTVIITRAEGRTPVPEAQRLSSLASHNATMILYLSAGLLDRVEEELAEAGCSPDTPAAIVYKATWADEKTLRCTVGTLKKTAEDNNITKTALIIIGNVLDGDFSRSRLYAPDFSTEYREAQV